MGSRGKGGRRRPNKGGRGRSSTPARVAAGSKQAGGAPTASQVSRQERQEALRRAHRRGVMRTRVVVALAVVAALAAVALLAGRGKDKDEDKGTSVAAGLTSGSCRLDTRSDPLNPNNPHVPNPSYQVDPPSGGDHLPTAAPAGSYSEASAPPVGQVVHAMEHGYVVFWYRPDLPAADRQKLLDAAEPVRSDVLVVPRASLPVPAAATAWHHRLLCGDLEPSVMTRFARQYRNQGPERISHPAI